MLKLSFITFILLFAVNLFAQSPHGDELKRDCADCHSSTNWKIISSEIKFDHSTTGFELSGQHRIVNCINCHESLVFSKAKNDCNSCHKDIHQNSVSPTCSNCHSTKNWLITNIKELHQMSRFPLVGVHEFQDCAQCHKKFSSLNFEVQGIECVDCHRSNYMAAKNPDHMQAGFPTNCQQCHLINQTTWGFSNFVHEFFPLVGGHKINNCFSCHQQGTFNGLSKDCYSCHRQNYETTTDPNHKQGNFSTDCSSCHTINGWRPANFDHNITAFPLTGAHVNTNCNSCHTNGFTGTPTDCYSCHKSNYDNTTDPNHVSSGFPTDCKQCHTTSVWKPANFDHNATAFPLTGKHTTVSCQQCHANGYNGTPTDCYSCHKSNYDNTTDPNHASSGFPTDCKQCHTTSAWSPANFDHSSTAFPLTGRHTTVSCNNCHLSGYAGTPTDCYSCHKSKYDNTSDPNHSAANFPTDCVQCHTTNGWTPASFDHDNQYFPIYSGRHNNRWNSCSDCHTNQNNFASHTCNAVCHKNDHHQNEDCFRCHPRGNE
ncbi:MAG TPA: hypothetical protein VKA26_03770 [Ignavibacteriaceae bacterium]|nr:hypothetical protein [Ignavibacteriaceae bacterium]